MGSRQLILASASPRRRRLLAEAGYRFEVMPANVPETAPPAGWSAAEHAEWLAIAKARDVAGRLDAGVVLGADTVVSLDNRIIGKPDNADHARAILRQLAGTRQAVITGVCTWDVEADWYLAGAECTWVTMRPMTDQEIAAYVASGEALGKAGAYAIQETGDQFVDTVEGSLTNVVGLPMERVGRMLAAAGIGPDRANP